MATQEEFDKMSESEKKKEDWMNSKWRPMMGWMYMAVCAADFILFPILWSLLQTVSKQTLVQWQPLTLQGAGLFHIAMGAVLGIAALGRTQEKIAGANNGGAALPSTPAPTGFGMPVSAPAPMPMARPTPMPMAAPAPVVNSGFGSSFGGGLDPSDPPVRNTRND